MSREVSNEASFRILGLSSEASWDEVKSAFRKLARRYHPDVAGPSGARKFAEITNAYMLLKEEIAPGATPNHHRSRSTADETVSAPKPQSLWRRLVGKFFGGFAGSKTKAATDDFEFSPARERFIESVLSRAEAQMNLLRSKREEIKHRNHVDGFTKRLRSRHPSVVLLALQQLSIRGMNDELRRILVEHFQKNTPTSEIISPLLQLFSSGDLPAALARSLARHACDMSPSDALQVLRWMKRHKVPKETASAYLKHGSAEVVAGALSHWDMSSGSPDVGDMTNLLKRNEENILVPLLRIMRREGVAAWALPFVEGLVKDHASSVVRVWASSIVRGQKIG